MNFDIKPYLSLIDNDKLKIIKNHILKSDIPLYLKHQNINNTLWITNSLMRYLYNISLSDFENYYPGNTFQNEIEGLRSDIHSPIYRNGNIFFLDCIKIKYTHFDYVIKILSYLIENTELDFDNIGKQKDIFDFIEEGKPKLNLLSKKKDDKNKKDVTVNEKLVENNSKQNTFKIAKKCKQIWILNPNNAIEIFLKKIEILLQSNSEFNNFIFVSTVNKIKYRSVNKIITSCSIIPIKINIPRFKYILNQEDNEIKYLFKNITKNNRDYKIILQAQDKILDYLLSWLNNDIILVKLTLLLWLKKVNNNDNLENKKLLISNVEHYTYLYIINEIPLFKLSNTLFQKFSGAKTINPIIDYYQYSFSLLSIPNIINDLVFYFNIIISKFLKYSEYQCIRNLDINQRIELSKLTTNLQYECIFLDKPISQLQSFFVDCIKIIKKY